MLIRKFTLAPLSWSTTSAFHLHIFERTFLHEFLHMLDGTFQ